MIETVNLNATFNEDAERYHRFRPNYPPRLFKSLIDITGINSQSKLLEIGPGTGQAALPLAQTGCKIMGIELGEDLAQLARDVLKPYPNAMIITGSFEESDMSPLSYDLIYSATAFHWIKPEYRFSKTAKLLKRDGYLAIIHTEHVSDEEGDEFFFASRPIYKKYAKYRNRFDENFRLPEMGNLASPHIENSLFELLKFEIFPIKISYTSKEFVGLLSTYSPTIAMPIKARQSFLSELNQLIDDKFGGVTVKKFAFTLTIAKKK